jgi:hypothetical protein
MESLKTAFENANSPITQFDDLWFWIIVFFIISDDIAKKKAKHRREMQQRGFKLANKPKRPQFTGPKIF